MCHVCFVCMFVLYVCMFVGRFKKELWEEVASKLSRIALFR